MSPRTGNETCGRVRIHDHEYLETLGTLHPHHGKVQLVIDKEYDKGPAHLSIMRAVDLGILFQVFSHYRRYSWPVDYIVRASHSM